MSPWSHGTSPKWLTAGYSLLAAAGVAAIVWPSPSIAASGRVWASVWAALLIVGGLSAAYGAARRIYYWEYAGLMPLVAVWSVYGLAALTSVAAGAIDRLAGSFALLAVAALLAARAGDMRTLRKAARALAHRRRANGSK